MHHVISVTQRRYALPISSLLTQTIREEPSDLPSEIRKESRREQTGRIKGEEDRTTGRGKKSEWKVFFHAEKSEKRMWDDVLVKVRYKDALLGSKEGDRSVVRTMSRSLAQLLNECVFSGMTCGRPWLWNVPLWFVYLRRRLHTLLWSRLTGEPRFLFCLQKGSRAHKDTDGPEKTLSVCISVNTSSRGDEEGREMSTLVVSQWITSEPTWGRDPLLHGSVSFSWLHFHRRWATVNCTGAAESLR